MTTSEVAAKLGITRAAVLSRAARRGIPATYQSNPRGHGCIRVFSLEDADLICEARGPLPTRLPKPVTPLSFEEFMRRIGEAA